MRLEGKIAIVTGGGSGIGLAIARRFAREGARVAVADREGERAARAAAELGERGLAVTCDVSRSADVQALVAATVGRWGRIDVLANNAGYGIPGSVVDVAEADWERLISVNLGGVFLCSRHVIPVMVRGGGGSIVNTASYTGAVGIPDRAAYVASKGAVMALTRAMALDHVKDNVRVNAVAPGTVSSPYFDAMLAAAPDREKMLEGLRARAPQHRLGTPEEIASAVLWLASDEASFATGSILFVDGGSSAW